MANRRMFSKSITQSSSFLMMPPSSRLLYYDLGMSADDDGYSEYFGVMRMTGSDPDDLRVLEARRFVQVFDDKVLIILDWKENNYIQADRYTPSKYLKSHKPTPKKMLLTQQEDRIQDVYKVDTQYRLGKVRLGKDINTHTYTTLESVNDEVLFQELADKYQTTIEIVRNAYDSLENYVGSKKSRTYTDYKKALSTFVKGDLEKLAKVQNSYQKYGKPNIGFIDPH